MLIKYSYFVAFCLHKVSKISFCSNFGSQLLYQFMVKMSVSVILVKMELLVLKDFLVLRVFVQMELLGTDASVSY